MSTARVTVILSPGRAVLLARSVSEIGCSRAVFGVLCLVFGVDPLSAEALSTNTRHQTLNTIHRHSPPARRSSAFDSISPRTAETKSATRSEEHTSELQ